MLKVCVLQVDNRPNLDYLLKTKEVNKKWCKKLGYAYMLLMFDPRQYGDIDSKTKKIYILNDFLYKSACDVLIFLDSDAWIQNGYWLNKIVTNLMNEPDIHGAFSRDPYVTYNTYINSGSFILKNNTYVKNMYFLLTQELKTDPKHLHTFPHDQYYISNFVYTNRDKFFIFYPEMLNTPVGKALRHNWKKNKKMYVDLNNLLMMPDEMLIDNSHLLNESNYYDTRDFPNKTDEIRFGLEYLY
jgi:hypothetical protein